MKLLLIASAFLLLSVIIWYVIKTLKVRRKNAELIYPDFKNRVARKSLFQYNPESGKTEFINGSSIQYPESPVQNHGADDHYPTLPFSPWNDISTSTPPSITDTPSSWSSNDSPTTDFGGGDFGGSGASGDY